MDLKNVVLATLLVYLGICCIAPTAEQIFETTDAEAASPVDGRATCETPASNLKKWQRKFITGVHNNFRRKIWAANMKEMKWGDALSRRAQALSNTCTFQHGLLETCSGSRMGQNLYATYGSTTFPKLNLTKVVESWFNEKSDYKYKTNTCDNVCGHYTQVVWAESNRVGCALTKCPELTLKGGQIVSNGIMVTCNYLKPGNYAGVKPFIQGKKCSQCQAGLTCQNKLCAPK